MVDVVLCFTWLSLSAEEGKKAQKSAGRGRGRRACVVWTPEHCAPSAAAQLLSVTFITPPSRRSLKDKHRNLRDSCPVTVTYMFSTSSTSISKPSNVASGSDQELSQS
ncbi:hypothetical protein AOLI_G00061390 [Acnodon oligacanthus]